MISSTEYIQLKAFARQDGLLVGALWVITFACFLGAIAFPALEYAFIAGFISTPFVVFSRLRNFRDKVLEGRISYARAVIYMMMTVGYASLILAAATFLYFKFMDNGMFMSTLTQNVGTPEMQEAMKQAGIDQKFITEQIATLSNTRPIELAFNVLWNCITTGLVMSLILGIVGRRSSNKPTNKQEK